MNVRVIVRVQVTCVEVIEGQRCEQVHNEPSAEIIQSDCPRVGNYLALSGHKCGAEIQDYIWENVIRKYSAQDLQSQINYGNVKDAALVLYLSRRRLQIFKKVFFAHLQWRGPQRSRRKASSGVRSSSQKTHCRALQQQCILWQLKSASPSSP